MFLVLRQSVSNVGEIIFESGPPGGEEGCHLPKKVVVPFFPETPSGHKENIHEHWPDPRTFCYMQKLQPVAMHWPRDP